MKNFWVTFTDDSKMVVSGIDENDIRDKFVTDSHITEIKPVTETDLIIL